MSASEARNKGEEIAAKYNSDGVVPFPFEKIVEEVKELRILELDVMPENISGAIGFSEKINKFSILINATKPERRKYFTLAHEMGHYFLHSESIRKSPDKLYIDPDLSLDVDRMVFREDTAPSSSMEREANNFAGALLMPEAKVREAWEKLKDVQRCAELFCVSIVAMSVRLQILGLPDSSK